MKKYVFVYYGSNDAGPTPEIMEAWGKWMAEVGDAWVDQGAPFMPGRAIQAGEASAQDIPAEMWPATGYGIVNAESMEEAEKLAAGCPNLTGSDINNGAVRIYEQAAM